SLIPSTSTAALSPLSLHDALPISDVAVPFVIEQHVNGFRRQAPLDLLDRFLGRPRQQMTGEVRNVRTAVAQRRQAELEHVDAIEDRKSTRLNSSHQIISYAVFCLK